MLKLAKNLTNEDSIVTSEDPIHIKRVIVGYSIVSVRDENGKRYYYDPNVTLEVL